MLRKLSCLASLEHVLTPVTGNLDHQACQDQEEQFLEGKMVGKQE